MLGIKKDWNSHALHEDKKLWSHCGTKSYFLRIVNKQFSMMQQLYFKVYIEKK